MVVNSTRKPIGLASRAANLDPNRPVTKSIPVATSTASRFSDTFRRRRSGIWAVGIPVIVIAGVYIGAQYKESQQVQERLNALKRDKDKSSALSAFSPGAAHTNTATGEQSNGALILSPQDNKIDLTVKQNSQDMDGARGMDYNKRQISFLKDRRGVLMKQKFDLERKIERVREKKKREEEMEARRMIPVEGNK